MSVFFKDFRQHTNKKKLCEIAYYRKDVKMHMKNILDALSLHFELSLSPDPAKTKYQTMLKKKWYWTDDSTVENTAGLFQRSCSQHTYCLKHQLQGDPGPFSGLHRQLLSHTHSYTDTRHTHNLEQTIKYDWHVLYIDIFFSILLMNDCICSRRMLKLTEILKFLPIEKEHS